VRVAWLLMGVVTVLAAAEPVDRKDPAAVARAYSEALRRRDAAALIALVVPEKGVLAFIRITAPEAGPGAMLGERGLASLVLLPFGYQLSSTGKPTVTGDTARLELQLQVDVRPTLVLKKLPDGNWAVDVKASLQATAGDRPNELVRQIDQLSQLPAESTRQVEAQQQYPWQCLQQMRQLAEALGAYAEEHNGKYPLAAVWMDAITPYLEGEKPFRCPDHPKEEYSYAFNAAMGEKPAPRDWQEGQKTPLLLCAGREVANDVFTEAEVAQLKPRHGKVNVWHGVHDGTVLPAGATIAQLLQQEEATNACQRKLTILVQAAKQYAKTHGGLLPKAETWCDDLAPLVPKAADGANPFVCPAVEGAACTYAINRAVAGKALTDLVNHRKQLLLVEVDACALNTAVAPTQAPAKRHRNRWSMGQEPNGHNAYLNGGVQLGGR